MEDEKELKQSWGEMVEAEFPTEHLSPREESELSPEEIDRYDAPVIWVKRVYGLSSHELTDLINDAFKTHDVENAEVIYTHISTSEDKDHAYILINSKTHSEKLLEGLIPVVVPGIEGEEDDNTLDFDAAIHLEPRETQDPCTLYLWNLNYQGKNPKQISQYFEDLISSWCPVMDVIPQKDRYGDFNHALKIRLFCYEDTRKCIYLLNYNEVEEVLIRAGFCNIDHTVISRFRPKENDRNKALKKLPAKKNSVRLNLKKTPPKKKHSGDNMKEKNNNNNNNNIVKVSKNGWIEIPKKNKSSKRK